MPEKIKILFICLGNICRSPLAEALFAKQLKLLGKEHLFEIDSCGTGDWHRGELADERTRKSALIHHIDITHRARQINIRDFEYYDYLLVMDNSNLSDVKALHPDLSSKSALITDYSDDFISFAIPDPYFGDEEGFEKVFDLLDKVTAQVANTIIHKHQTKP